MPFRRHPTDADEHRDHERIVELTRLPSRFAAEVAVAALDARGIKATADHGDAGGWAPQLSAFQGHRVLVFEGDLEIARTLLSAEGLSDADLSEVAPSDEDAADS